MKTTLVIPDPIFRDVKRRAAERGETLSELVTEYLRQGLQETRKRTRLRSLPSYSAGIPKVNIADRDAVYRVMEEG